VLGGRPRRIRQESVIGGFGPRIVRFGSPRVVLEKSNTLQQMLLKETTAS
jgi:hypothetical protein